MPLPSITAALIDELHQEAATTRRVLERVPEEHLSWRPHAKSMSLGQLALHIARIPGAIAELLSELERDPPVVPLPEAASRAESVDHLAQSVARAAQALADWGEAGLSASWTMKREGRILFTLPRVAMVRSIMLNHWYHHRGELMVYFRLLDIPVPSVYGPSADEKPLG
jgi:uncharacterized damage-inducible protein DinB